MRSLAELQNSVARAMTTGVREPAATHLVGGAEPGKRLDIHLRHYEASLSAALGDKFAACAWLAGADLVGAAARAFVHDCPPRQPYIAEYGKEFPHFLARFGRASTLPYLEDFAWLEWAVGRVSIAIDHQPLSWSNLTLLESSRLLDCGFKLQPGLRYVDSAWGIDELMTMYLSGAQPERFVLPELDTFIEARGARGTVHLARLDRATFEFRVALAAGSSMCDAAADAIDHDPKFDAGEALRLLVTSGLAVRITVANQESLP